MLCHHQSAHKPTLCTVATRWAKWSSDIPEEQMYKLDPLKINSIHFSSPFTSPSLSAVRASHSSSPPWNHWIIAHLCFVINTHLYFCCLNLYTVWWPSDPLCADVLCETCPSPGHHGEGDLFSLFFTDVPPCNGYFVTLISILCDVLGLICTCSIC